MADMDRDNARTLVIKGRLPGINEIFSAANANRYKGAAIKRSAQETVVWCIKQQLRAYKASRPIRLHYAYYEPNARRDYDNIAGGAHKVIQDALKESGVIPDDRRKYVCGFTDLTFAVDKENPRVEVIIEEVEDLS
jgi:Holliday junction resolvase RusA-like endonuclease